MSATKPPKFPSGRSVKRAKQDAKALAKRKNIPLHQALDEIAQINGSVKNWSKAVASLQNNQSLPNIMQTQQPGPLALELGISESDLEQLNYDVQTNENNNGFIYDYILTFDDACSPEILEKIEGLSEDNTKWVSVNAFDEPEPPDELLTPFPVKTDMNPYRKLLVAGLNEILSRGLLSLNWDDESRETTSHIETLIAGHNSIVSWSDAGHGEVRISVWWKYDHSKHPQANSKGMAQESFSTPSPLAKRQHYPKFVGVVCSAWLERDNGIYIQGQGNDHIFKKYTRKNELEYLKRLPNPIPNGFKPEGRFHM